MKKFYAILLFLAVSITGVSIANVSHADTTVVEKPAVSASGTNEYVSVQPIDLVKSPEKYLNKKITMTSRFSKFSTLGLDYKPALRESDNYISFMFLRDDSANKIPLSELKMFVSRKVVEKLPDIKENDKIRVEGQVFSTALGDAWVDVNKIDIIK